MTFEEWLAANYQTAGEGPLMLVRAAWDAGRAAGTAEEQARCVQVATDAARRYTCATRAKTCLALAGALGSAS